MLDEHNKKFAQEYQKEILTLSLALNALSEKPALSDSQSEGIKKKLGYETKIEVTGKNSVTIFLEGVNASESSKEKYDAAVKMMITGGSHRVLLYQSALISLISSVEWFISQTLREYFEEYPEAAGIKDKQLTLEELKSFDSINDARKYLIDIRIDEIMRGSFEDWLKFFSEKVKLSLGYLKPSKDLLGEIFQRRNVVVHNNGIANSIYFYKVPSDLRENVSLGKQLLVSREYLNKSIDLIESNFILLGAELWKQLDANDEGRGSILIEVSFDRLMQQRWFVAESLSYFTKNDKGLTERDQTVGLLNYWQALKWQGRLNEVRRDIDNVDFSAKDEMYRLARFALLDDYKEFFNLLPQVLHNKKLGVDELKTWPIFQGIRQTNEYAEFVRTRGKEFEFEQFDTNKTEPAS